MSYDNILGNAQANSFCDIICSSDSPDVITEFFESGGTIEVARDTARLLSELAETARKRGEEEACLGFIERRKYLVAECERRLS